jgi:peptide deformylase
MVIRRILTAEEPILRERAKKVTQFDASLHRLLDDMFYVLTRGWMILSRTPREPSKP